MKLETKDFAENKELRTKSGWRQQVYSHKKVRRRSSRLVDTLWNYVVDVRGWIIRRASHNSTIVNQQSKIVNHPS
jgi:hypothetical protein